MGAFGEELFKLVGGEHKGGHILTAAHMCIDPHHETHLERIPFDAILVQFYNNRGCENDREVERLGSPQEREVARWSSC